MQTRPLGTFPFSSFWCLNWTQFLGAMNDNIFKLLIVYCFINLHGSSSSSSILAACGAIYVVPFLLFSSTAGALADRYSKKMIIVITKSIEIAVMSLGVIAFSTQNLTLAFVALFLLATHSAVFAPCKYGILPEIVSIDAISKANGILTSCTYVAIIIGTFLASFLTEISNRNFLFASTFSFAFAIIGLLASLNITKTPPAAAEKTISVRFLSELVKTLKIIRKEPSLLSCAIGSAYFLFVGSFVQLNMIPYAMNVLQLSDIQGGYLFLLTAIGIGVGSLLAGKFSGKVAELGLVPIGGIGMALCCFLLDHFSGDIALVIPFVILLGTFGGLYLVPLDSFIQIASPSAYRGQIIGTVNFFGFVGVLISSGTLYFLNDILGLDADEAFSIIGMVTFMVISLISIAMSGYIVRFFSFMLSRLFYPITLKNKEEIPLQQPSFFFTSLPSWPWSCALLASQRRRMRLFTLPEQQERTLATRLAQWFIPTTEVSSVHDLLPKGEYSDIISHALSRGTSITIFYPTTLEGAQTHISSRWKEEAPNYDAHFVLHPIKNGIEMQSEGKRLLTAEAVRL